MKPAQDLEKLVKKLNFKASAALHSRTINDALKAQTKSTPAQQNIWRTIMKSRITRFAAAAVILIAISVLGWLSSDPGIPEDMSSFTLLANACAAEQSLFFSNSGIAHIANEIILYPALERNGSDLLTDLESDVTSEKNIAFTKSWLSHQWIPVYSLTADGELSEHRLNLTPDTKKSVTISDLAWYEPTTGRFVRVLKTGDQVLFANAFDGEYIYLALTNPDGATQTKKAVTGEFRIPDNPADFLGIAAGIRRAVPREHFPPIQDVKTEIMEDGTRARVYKMGFADPWGKVDTYYLFKLSTDTDVIAEIECVVNNKTTRVHKRMMSETVESPEFSWNLTEISEEQMGTSGIKVEASEGIKTITPEQMAERATSTAYLFAKAPSWTSECRIYDLPDEMSPPARFFSITYSAKDGRDVVLVQGESFTRYFNAIFKKIQEVDEPISWTYVSKNGFKVRHQDDKEGEMWWTEFALKSSGFEPAANRVGYILQSPAGTYLVLAINGPVSMHELKSIIDSLVPADKFVSN
jgi:hypothetical protein